VIADRTRSMIRAAVTLLVVATAYELTAQSGVFAKALMPTLPRIASRLMDMIADGTLFWHTFYTLYRMLTGFALAIVVGLPLGILMGRVRPVENFCLPLMSALMPIPSLAWVPVFILWFGLGNTVSILIVFYAAMFPMVLNAWTGVRSVNQLWLRAAGAMGADETARRPSSSPGCARLSCARGSRSSVPRCSRPPTGGLVG
jgi:ABC-type nitrate/sulfonate/bicarbonate transport system permease component